MVFKEHEGSFLVGMAAALASKTGKVGFVGGMDIPLIRNFEFGYEQGVKHVNPKAEVIVNYTGTTPAAWNDPARGGELAIGQFAQGADVVYAAAGATGLGVLQAAADKGKLSIGVDSNQNHLHPGSVLTSMLKRVDVAVYDAFKSAKDGTWQPGMQSLGLKEERRRLRARRPQPRGADARDAGQDRRGQGRRSSPASSRSSPTSSEPQGGGGAGRRRDQLPGALPPAVELRGIDKRFGAVHANRAIDLVVAGGHDPRHRRRERRRQVDPDEHPLRLLPGRRRRRS